MKKLYIFAFAVLALCGCDAMLDTTNWTKYDTSQFPTSQKDAEQIITGAYNAIGDLFQEPERHNLFVSNAAGDDMFGGGSTSNVGAQGEDRLMLPWAEGLSDAWKQYYKGIFRANYALSVIPEMDDALFENTDTKNYLIGQAYFLRGFYYWQLFELFEQVPILTTPEAVNNPRASADEVAKQIAEDLVNAIDKMPAKYGYNAADGMAGRATKYAAEALLARVWMFYTGFYKKADLNGISKSQIITYLKDVVDKSGFGLESDPREIWPYTNDYTSGVEYGTDFGTYVNKENLHWVGNHSKETLWATHFSIVNQYAPRYNRIGEYYSLRNSASSPNEKTYPFGIGYTNGTVNPKMVEEWHEDPDYGPSDKRLWGSIYAVDNANETYSWLDASEVELASHDGNDSKEVEKTKFHNKKYAVSVAYSGADKAQLFKNFFYAVPGIQGANSNQFDNRNDCIYIRYADVLLMLDELEGTVTGMNALRARAGLAPYASYSFEKLQKERRYELCFEGIRYNDMRRWYPDNAGEKISANQVGAYCEYRGEPTTYKEIPGNGLQKRYQETRGFWKISDTQITLSEDVLVETPGWTTESWLFSNGDLPK